MFAQVSSAGSLDQFGAYPKVQEFWDKRLV
jgi:hypothetical protein